jgi:hypothetical protein
LSHVELIERLALAMQRKSIATEVAVAQTGQSPEPPAVTIDILRAALNGLKTG